MHADIHLQLHALTAEELRNEAAAVRPDAPARVPALRARLGWKLVELGLRLVTPARHPAALAA
ncbi:hypothetical protein [Streptomyces sp. NK15101]|uniref:hypothetical protein n=1 Tax=Streptomyces sp. NK15101 TaxID=2873261 RepID=UPI001CED104E|nr:hypothetical protein [Streptomyces sp. NK15101]